jgi:hypothetical protein
MRWSHDRLSLRFLSRLSSRRQLLLCKAARAQATLQRVSARHSAPRDLEYGEAVGLSSPGQQRTPRAETSTSRPPKEIRCRRQMCSRGTRAATVDDPAEDLQIVHLHPGVAYNATSIRKDHGMIGSPTCLQVSTSTKTVIGLSSAFALPQCVSLRSGLNTARHDD